MSFQFVISFIPIILGVIVYKNGRVPATLQSSWSSVEAFAAFVEEHVPRRQDNLVRAAVEIFNKNRPRFGIFTGVNMENKANHMGLHFVYVHRQLDTIRERERQARTKATNVEKLWVETHPNNFFYNHMENERQFVW